MKSAVSPRTLAAAAVASVTAIFLLSWWNRFLAGTGVDSVFLFAGRELLNGRIPYRDFDLVVPPFEVFKSAWMLSWFPSEPFAAIRMLGLIERCAGSVFLLLWLTRLFPLPGSVIAATVSMVLFSASSADPMAGYNQSASTWAVISGFFASRVLSRGRWPDALCAGIAGACAFLVKQTTGFGLLAVTGLVLLGYFWRSAGFAGALRAVLQFAAGVALILGSVAMWLYSHGALGAFIRAIFLQGATSKGPLWMTLLRPLRMTLSDAWLRQEAALAVLIVAVLGAIALRRKYAEASAGSHAAVIASAAACLAALAAGFALTILRPQLVHFARIDMLERTAVYVTMAGALLLVIVNLARPSNVQVLLFAGISLALAYMHALSFVITNGILVPGLAFLIAFALSRLKHTRLARAVAVLCLIALSLSAFRKWMVPFAWYGWADSPVAQSQPVSLPEAGVLHAGAEQQQFATRLTAYLRDYSGPNHEAYLFFYMPEFYVLSGTHPVTRSFAPFIDVASDAVAGGDAEILRRSPPPVIAYTVVDSGELAAWEHDFRAGRISGQRTLVAAIEDLVREYRLLDTLSMPGTGRPVRIYARLDVAAAKQ